MSESNYLPTGDQQPFAQLCNWQSRGAGCSGRSSGWAPVGSPIQCDSAQFRDYPTQSKCLSNCEQSDCAGSRADSGVSMSYNSCTSFDNLSSIPEDSHHLPDISHLRITSEPASVTVSVRVYDEGTSIHDTGSVCKDTVCDSGLGSEVRTSVESTPQPTSVHFSSSANPEYGECERFQQNEDRDTFLHLAIIYGEEAYAEETIKMAVHRESLSIYNNLQQTPLHLAVLTNLPSLVKLLVARGAVVDARDRHGNTPLHIACRNGLLECSVALTTPVEWQYALEAPVFSPHQQIPQDMNIKNYEGETCLHMAATGRHPETIHYLTRYAGADINAKEGKSGRTIIHYLAEQPDADLLLETLRLPGVNVNARTYDGSTPLSLACGRGHANVEAVLLAVGAAMTSADSDSDSDSGDDMMDFNDFQIAGQPISS